MTELFIWIATHPDVKVRFHKDSILNSLVIRVIKGRYISQHAMDASEYHMWYCLTDEKQRTYLMIELLNNLYDNLVEAEDD